MDEILVNNFMVLRRGARDGALDLVVGDEAWDVDHFLHENPELKRGAVRLAHRLRRLAADAGRRRAREACLTADYNAEMLEHRERGSVACATGRSSSATPTTWCPTRSGRGCRRSASWTEEKFDFAGYVTGFDPAGEERRAGCAARLG